MGWSRHCAGSKSHFLTSYFFFFQGGCQGRAVSVGGIDFSKPLIPFLLFPDPLAA